MSLLTSLPEPTQAETLYRELKRRLMIGAFLPDQKLSLRKLSVEMDTGIMPVREALKRLASERVLSSSVKKSYVVPALDKKRAADLFNLRALLESEAATLAAPFIDADQMVELRSCVDRVHETIMAKHFDSYMVENQHFHFLIYRQCGNADMIALIEQLWMQTGPSLRQGVETSYPDPAWTDVHLALLDALHKNRASGIRRHLLQDIRWDWAELGTPSIRANGRK
ncbi:MAG: GntR family transcriptional regulator [Paracoccaceae bacterium]|nr:GntR family transcriptional regulator [Paracoccaceae bacterium]